MGVARFHVGRLFFALIIAANLLHAPSLALQGGKVDCASAIGDMHGHHQGPPIDGDEPRQQAPHHVSVCPFANASVPLVGPAGAIPVRIVSSPVAFKLGDRLVAADLETEDPPPRLLSWATFQH